VNQCCGAGTERSLAISVAPVAEPIPDAAPAPTASSSTLIFKNVIENKFKILVW
jgi:hypothetical protein